MLPHKVQFAKLGLIFKKKIDKMLPYNIIIIIYTLLISLLRK